MFLKKKFISFVIILPRKVRQLLISFEIVYFTRVGLLEHETKEYGIALLSIKRPKSTTDGSISRKNGKSIFGVFQKFSKERDCM